LTGAAVAALTNRAAGRAWSPVAEPTTAVWVIIYCSFV
jgi:hypothetical protein